MDTGQGKWTEPEERRDGFLLATERLLLREYEPADFDALYPVLSDPETMAHYPAPFDAERVKGWIRWNCENYRDHGFGLWAVVLQETGQLIGDCGITLQTIDGKKLPEIGYHIRKDHWRKGYGSEAAKAVRDWAFRNTDYDALYSYMKHTNTASRATAEALGMAFLKEYPDRVNEITCVYRITRNTWETTAR